MLANKTKKARNPSRLQRHAGVKRRKQHVVNGHKFFSQQFYQFVKCALCQEYLMTGIGFRCDGRLKVAYEANLFA